MTYTGNCRLGDLFESRRERGSPGMPLLSVTMNDGLVNREDLDRKQDSELTAEEHLLVKPGDIAYNMMRMWQGALGLASCDGIVSPAYVVLKPRQHLDPLYAYYLLKSPRVRYLLWAYSYGITNDRLRLYFDDFARIPVSVPDISRQRAIGKTLATWDKAIAAAERLSAVERLQADEAVARSISGGATGAKKVLLGDCAQVIVSSVDKRTSAGERPVWLCNYTDVYYSRHLRRDHRYVGGTASQAEIERFTVCAGDVVITKDSEDPRDIGVATCVLEAPENLVCGYHLAIIRPQRGVLDGVVLQALFSLESTRRHLFAQSNGVTRFGLPVKAIETVTFVLPSLAYQGKLANFLLASEARSRARHAEILTLKRERDALVQRLLPQQSNH